MSLFKVSKSESVVTPESVENSDIDHDLSGMVGEDIEMSVKDLAREFENVGVDLKNTNGKDFYGYPYTSDYRLGHETTECVHVHCGTPAAERALQRVVRVLIARERRRLNIARFGRAEP